MPLPIRPNILAMSPYPAGKPADAAAPGPGVSRVVKLASNENPLGPSPKAVQAAAAAAAGLHAYPDASYSGLREALASHLGVAPGNVAVGNGSDDLIHLLGLCFLGSPEDEVVVGTPSFVRYDATAHVSGCRLQAVPCTEDWRLDAAAMAEAVSGSTRLVFVANPNNPTGTYLKGDELLPLAQALEGRGLLVLDEAYFEFALGADGYPDALAWVREGLPVAVLRTFSKAHGLAGARLGCLAGPAELVEALDRAREPFLVNSAAQAAAVASLADPDHVQRSVAVAKESIGRIAEGCRALGLETVPSVANFVCVRVGDDLEIAASLERAGYLVRPGSKIGMPGFVRVSAALPEDTDGFLDALRLAAGRSAVPA